MVLLSKVAHPTPRMCNFLHSHIRICAINNKFFIYTIAQMNYFPYLCIVNQ